MKINQSNSCFVIVYKGEKQWKDTQKLLASSGSFMEDWGFYLRTVAVAGGGLIAILSLPEVIAGFALLKFKEWGRILSLIVAALNVIWFPFGTALSIYTFVILLNTETATLFKTKS